MDSEIKIIDGTEEAEIEFGLCYGSFSIPITEKQIKALQEGKTLATTINGKEYTIFISKRKKEINFDF